MTRPRGGDLSRWWSSSRSRGASSNLNVVHEVSKCQVIGRCQTAEDINKDTTIQKPADEEGNHSDIAIWIDELTSSILEL